MSQLSSRLVPVLYFVLHDANSQRPNVAEASSYTHTQTPLQPWDSRNWSWDLLNTKHMSYFKPKPSFLQPPIPLLSRGLISAQHVETTVKILSGFYMNMNRSQFCLISCKPPTQTLHLQLCPLLWKDQMECPVKINKKLKKCVILAEHQDWQEHQTMWMECLV